VGPDVDVLEHVGSERLNGIGADLQAQRLRIDPRGHNRLCPLLGRHLGECHGS
jgi:hypothetical protein